MRIFEFFYQRVNCGQFLDLLPCVKLLITELFNTGIGVERDLFAGQVLKELAGLSVDVVGPNCVQSEILFFVLFYWMLKLVVESLLSVASQAAGRAANYLLYPELLF